MQTKAGGAMTRPPLSLAVVYQKFAVTPPMMRRPITDPP